VAVELSPEVASVAAEPGAAEPEVASVAVEPEAAEPEAVSAAVEPEAAEPEAVSAVAEPGAAGPGAVSVAAGPVIVSISELQASGDIVVAFAVSVPASVVAVAVYSSGHPNFPAFPNGDYFASSSSSVEVVG
jgi:hypothetical protein